MTAVVVALAPVCIIDSGTLDDGTLVNGVTLVTSCDDTLATGNTGNTGTALGGRRTLVTGRDLPIDVATGAVPAILGTAEDTLVTVNGTLAIDGTVVAGTVLVSDAIIPLGLDMVVNGLESTAVLFEVIGITSSSSSSVDLYMYQVT